ncbi:MAG: hypothetical protein JW900_05605 [Anaerolineae bacterium]|nr:hypothetical protein [Anaerolineae bacterium]
MLLVCVLFRFIQLPEESWQFNVLGSPLEIRITGTWFLVALLAALVGMGTRYVLLGHPAALSAQLPRPLYISWVLPILLGGMCAYLIATAPIDGVWAAGLVAGGMVIGLAVAAEFGALSIDAPSYAISRLALNVLAYLLAFAFFYVTYSTRARSIITASSITVVAFLIALDLLSVADVSVTRVALYAGIIALIVGQVTWALNYWRLGSWSGSLALLVVFYLSSGITHQYLLERLNLRVLFEFGIVAMLVLLATLLFAP